MQKMMGLVDFIEEYILGGKRDQYYNEWVITEDERLKKNEKLWMSKEPIQEKGESKSEFSQRKNAWECKKPEISEGVITYQVNDRQMPLPKDLGVLKNWNINRGSVFLSDEVGIEKIPIRLALSTVKNKLLQGGYVLKGKKVVKKWNHIDHKVGGGFYPLFPDVVELNLQGYKTIVCFRSFTQCDEKLITPEKIRSMGMEFHNIIYDPKKGIDKNQLNQLLNLIETSNKKVYICCCERLELTKYAIAAYLGMQNGLDGAEAISKVENIWKPYQHLVMTDYTSLVIKYLHKNN